MGRRNYSSTAQLAPVMLEIQSRMVSHAMVATAVSARSWREATAFNTRGPKASEYPGVVVCLAPLSETISHPSISLGKGLYSARMSSKATLYAENSAPDGSEWDSDYLAVLVNTVSVGRVYITEEPLQGMIQPPLFYQSTYGTGSAFADELAVYHEDAIRPAYLIVCENVAVTSFAADPDDEDRLNERDLYNRLPSFTSETFHSSFVEKSIGRTTAAVENSQGRVTCPCGWCAVSGTEGDGYDEPNEYDECYGSDVVDGQLLSAAFGFTPTY
ncbi:hypothetical protein FRB96_003964 [Tulasnella sp. 330]|nr:hypothetical protein FRB96_003964 [Tulasnella sp. 330]